MTRLTQEQIEKIIELRKNATMDNASIATQIGCKKSTVSYIAHKACKYGVAIPRARKQTKFEKAIQKFPMKKSETKFDVLSECCHSLVTKKTEKLETFPYSRTHNVCLNCNKICELKIIYATDSRQAEKKAV